MQKTEEYHKNKERIKANENKPSRKKQRKKYLEQYSKDNKDLVSETKSKCYQKKKEEYKERIYKRIREHTKLVSEIKGNYGCMNENCKWSEDTYDPVILDFHHCNAEQKNAKVSQMFCRSKHIIAEEINKCVVFCANCHRLFHKDNYSLTNRCNVNEELLWETDYSRTGIL